MISNYNGFTQLNTSNVSQYLIDGLLVNAKDILILMKLHKIFLAIKFGDKNK